MEKSNNEYFDYDIFDDNLISFPKNNETIKIITEILDEFSKMEIENNNSIHSNNYYEETQNILLSLKKFLKLLKHELKIQNYQKSIEYIHALIYSISYNQTWNYLSNLNQIDKIFEKFSFLMNKVFLEIIINQKQKIEENELENLKKLVNEIDDFTKELHDLKINSLYILKKEILENINFTDKNFCIKLLGNLKKNKNFSANNNPDNSFNNKDENNNIEIIENNNENFQFSSILLFKYF